MPLFVIFIVIPLIELALFATVSQHVGIWTTLSLAFLTAIIGGSLVRHQGLQTLFAVRKSANQGQMPLNEIFDGFCIVAAGALLITPGFLTDAIGFALLIPTARAAARHFIKTRTQWSVHNTNTASAYQNYKAPHDDIIEGEYEEIKERPDKLE